uniref:PHD finger protein ALFIN-LIKE n=1 Tax=Oryza brachyantha TaxID=4533 RepID=J3MMV7_ORYBR
MDGGAQYNPRTVEEVFRDFKGRRAGLVRALTTDVEDFFRQCDPEKENLCLYGFPNEHWEVNLPAEEVPPELPEPALGINFARDGMQEKDWLSMVAVHSDAWLLSVAFYFGARFGFDKNDRKRLFSMINDLPTIFDVVSGKSKSKPPGANNHSNSKSKSNNKTKSSEARAKQPKPPPQAKNEDLRDEDGGPDDEEGAGGGGGREEEHGETLCGACGESYGADEFWICCDICEKWFHGKCVKITPAKAEHIKQYKCPSCSGSNGGAGAGSGNAPFTLPAYNMSPWQPKFIKQSWKMIVGENMNMINPTAHFPLIDIAGNTFGRNAQSNALGRYTLSCRVSRQKRNMICVMLSINYHCIKATETK